MIIIIIKIIALEKTGWVRYPCIYSVCQIARQMKKKKRNKTNYTTCKYTQTRKQKRNKNKG
jgi:hypothetical protein